MVLGEFLIGHAAVMAAFAALKGIVFDQPLSDS
jgi:hypothetical protein